jgi:hypothetical protein
MEHFSLSGSIFKCLMAFRQAATWCEDTTEFGRIQSDSHPGFRWLDDHIKMLDGITDNHRANTLIVELPRYAHIGV